MEGDTAEAQPKRPLIDIGWVLAGRLDDEDRLALRLARQKFQEKLEALFPGFRWRMSRMARRALTDEQRRRPEQLLDGWVPSLGGDIGTLRRLTYSGFVAFLGLIVGALGASFEEQTYFAT